jgi:hypothetical protein
MFGRSGSTRTLVIVSFMEFLGDQDQVIAQPM